MWSFGTHAEEKYTKGNENAYSGGIIRQSVHTASYSTFYIQRTIWEEFVHTIVKKGKFWHSKEVFLVVLLQILIFLVYS